MAEELIGRIHADHLGVQLADKHVHHHVALVQAQQAVVDKHAGELIADGAVDQRGGHRRINAAGQTQDDLFVADLFADFLNRFFNVVAHDPIGPGTANVEHEALQQGPTLHRMGHFGVELHRVIATVHIGHASNGAALGAGHELEARRHFGDLVAVAHPDLQHAVAFWRVKVGDIFQQRGMAAGAHFGVAKLACGACLDLATQLLRHGLHPIADAQHRHAQFEHRVRRLVVHLVHAGVAAGKNHALELAVGRKLAHPFAAHIAGVHFAIHMRFAHAAGDELGDLGTEIEDEDFLVLHGVVWLGCSESKKAVHQDGHWRIGAYSAR